MSAQSTRKEGLTGWHVLFLLIAFFGLVFAVNAYFIGMALTTHTGVVANEPYRKGLAYNERIVASERQAQLGWTEKLSISSNGARLIFELQDGQAQPIRGLIVTARIGRPATTEGESTITLSEASAGRYEAVLPEGESGAFIANIEAKTSAREDTDVLYRARKRLWRKP